MASEATAVTIDLWHTLLYLGPAEEEVYMRGQAEVAVNALSAAPIVPGVNPAPRSELFAIYDRVLSEAVAAAEQGRTVTPAEQYRAMAKEAGRRPSLPPYLAALADLVHRTPLAQAPGGIEALRRLHDAGHRVAVISNTVGEPGASIRPTLTREGFDPYVDLYTFSDEHPWTKPAPEIFLTTLRTLGASPARSVHVGDGWSDIEGAHRAGYRAGVLYAGLSEYGPKYLSLFRGPSGSELRPQHTIRRLDELPELVDRLLAA
jgi:HAD superfamily hydrolase (TIGR01549 family)